MESTQTFSSLHEIFICACGKEYLTERRLNDHQKFRCTKKTHSITYITMQEFSHYQNRANKRLTLEEFREKILAQSDKKYLPYICACGERTDNLCPRCRRPNCILGIHSHFCAINENLILG